MAGARMIKQMSRCHQMILIKLVLSPDHTCFIIRAPSITSWSHLFYRLISFVYITQAPSIPSWTNLFHHLMTFVWSPEHLPFPLDQTCFITWWHLFYHPSTFHSLLITLVLSSDHICLYHPSTFHSLLIKLVSSPDHICFITRAPSIPSWSNFFYHLITLVLSSEHLPLPLDHTCFIAWSHLFISSKHLPFPLDQLCFITWWHLFYHPYKQMWSDDKTSVIKKEWKVLGW
jgi:hypothetical protein